MWWFSVHLLWYNREYLSPRQPEKLSLLSIPTALGSFTCVTRSTWVQHAFSVLMCWTRHSPWCPHQTRSRRQYCTEPGLSCSIKPGIPTVQNSRWVARWEPFSHLPHCLLYSPDLECCFPARWFLLSSTWVRWKSFWLFEFREWLT